MGLGSISHLRKEFANSYKTLLLFLGRISIPVVFPEKAESILKLFNTLYDVAYKDKQSLKKNIDNDLNTFGRLMGSGKDDNFIELARCVVERIEKRPRKLLFISLLNNRLKAVYDHYICFEKGLEIIDNPEEDRLVEDLMKK